MKIIQNGNLNKKEQVHRLKCPNCECIFEFNESELIHLFEHMRIKCPFKDCNNYIKVRYTYTDDFDPDSKSLIQV